MTLKEVLGFVLLTLGVAGVFLGIGAVLRDIHFGWLAFVVGGALSYLSHRIITKASRDEEALVSDE